MQEAGKGLLTSGEHVGIAGLDLLLRLGVDLAVMQRRAPVRRTLEYGEMPDLAGDGLMVCTPVAPVPITRRACL
jgi:hypothetical protein